MCKSVNIYFLALPMLCRGFKWELERTFPTPIPSEKMCSFPTSRNTIIAPTVKCQQSIHHKMNVPFCRPCAIIQFFCRKNSCGQTEAGREINSPIMYIVIRAMTIHAEREYVKDGHSMTKGYCSFLICHGLSLIKFLHKNGMENHSAITLRMMENVRKLLICSTK